MEKRIDIIILIVLLSIKCLGQDVHNTGVTLEWALLEKEIFLSSEIENHRSKHISETKKLKRIFYSIKSKYLRSHVPNSALASTLKKGEYDCVTGTMLYGYVLNELGYEFSVREFDFHMFLVVQIEGKEILFESTDDYGLIRRPEEIQKRISFYTKGKTSLNQEISLENALGLYYFNQAVESFNNRDFKNSRNWIDKACLVYSSERIQGFKGILNTPQLLIASSD